MKKVLSLVLALSMILSMFSYALAGFKDVENTKYAGAVESLAELGVVNGYSDGTFQPNKVVSRAEIAKMLVIALGQEKAADLAKGTTKFSDVAADNWATGFINVASQSNVITGYPDGTFRPEATVSYAEAVTMAVRALGYGRVVELAGTWPTNYMTKAAELELLDDIDNPNGADGATRGNVAILLWNMLTAHMWVIESENAKDGVTYAKGDLMLNVKFEDYQYIEEARVVNIYVNDGEVEVTLDLDADFTIYRAKKDENLLEGELIKGDFLKLYGQKVTALFDKDEKEFLSITPTDDNKTVYGKVEEVDYEGDMIKVDGKEYTVAEYYDMIGYSEDDEDQAFVFMVLDGSKVVYVTGYGFEPSILVEKVKETTDGVRVYAEFGTNMDIDDEAIILKDGQWLTVDDIEVGDVVTELRENELYAISTQTVNGTFTKTEVDDSDIVMTVDGEEYTVSEDAMYYIDGEEEGLFTSKFDSEDMEDEEVVLTLNYLGVVVKVESGDVASEGNGDFYTMTSKGVWDVADSDGTVQYVKLMGANGEEETYTISEDAEEKDITDETTKGTAVYAEFDDGEVTLLTAIANEDVYGEDHEFTVAYIAALDEVDDSYLVEGSNRYKVNTDTVVYTIVTEEDDGDNKFVRVDVTEGIDALDDAEDQAVTLVYDSTFKTVKFAFIGDEGTSGLTFGKVERVYTKNGDKYVELSDSEGDTTEVEYTGTAPVVDTVLVYKVVSDELSVKRTLTPATAGLYTSKLVDDVDGSDIRLLSPSVVLMDLEDEDYEDYKVVLVNMNELDVAGTYEIDDISELDIEGLSLNEEDRLFVDNTNKVFAVFRGVDTGDLLTSYTITYNLAGGTAGTPANPTTYTVETGDIRVSNPTRTGYTFAGWTGSNGTEPNTSLIIAQGGAFDRTYTANWTPITYTISYVLNDENATNAAGNPATYTIETNTITLADPTITTPGYTFTGWTGTGLTEPTRTVTIPLGSTENRTYEANWAL
jgi:uncharacterized repeat protein (TIGR02543 family)